MVFETESHPAQSGRIDWRGVEVKSGNCVQEQKEQGWHTMQVAVGAMATTELAAMTAKIVVDDQQVG